jgi:hypothetical protein
MTLKWSFRRVRVDRLRHVKLLRRMAINRIIDVVTRRIFRSFGALLLCASIVAITLPLRAQIPPPSKLDCRAMMKPQHDASNDDGCPMKPMQQAQCCAACALAVTLFFATSSSFIAPTPPAETLSDRAARLSLRTDRPPVPPPR